MQCDARNGFANNHTNEKSQTKALWCWSSRSCREGIIESINKSWGQWHPLHLKRFESLVTMTLVVVNLDLPPVNYSEYLAPMASHLVGVTRYKAVAKNFRPGGRRIFARGRRIFTQGAKNFRPWGAENFRWGRRISGGGGEF